MVHSERYTKAYFSEFTSHDLGKCDISDERDDDVAEEAESGDAGDTAL